MSASIFERKSISNNEAALLLYENEYFASSIHCFYYSSLQLSISTLIKIFGYRYEDLGIKARGKKSSHVFYISLITDQITDDEVRRKFYDLATQLKRLRVQADYETLEMRQFHCNIAKDLNLKIERILKTKLK